MSQRFSIEQCFEEAAERGTLFVQQRNLKSFPVCVDVADLIDVLHADISKNKFFELPPEILSFIMMEKLNTSSNYIKSLPDMSKLTALTSLDVSQNQLSTLPVHICSLPLKILKASYNRITVLPSQIGLLIKLQALDLSCNELTNLPSTMGELVSLCRLNVRRNQIVTLPDELSKLKNLASFDFSCNRVATIPPAFRLISSLISLDLTNNPLSSPPAHICMKGRLHIIKFLSLAAQQQEKRWTLPSESRVNRSPSASSLSSTGETEVSTLERTHEACDTTDNTRARRSTITNDDEDDDGDTLKRDSSRSSVMRQDDVMLQDLNHKTDIPAPQLKQRPSSVIQNESFRISPSKEKPIVPRKPGSLSLQDDPERQQVPKEKGRLIPHVGIEQNDSQFSTMSLDRRTRKGTQNNVDGHERQTDEQKMDLNQRKEQLLKSKEEILRSKQRLELLKLNAGQPRLLSSKPSSWSPSEVSPPNKLTSTNSDVVFDGIGQRSAIALKRNSKKLKDGASNYTMRRFYDSAKEEFEQLERLREAIETRLRIKLPDDLPASLSDGIVLCHLVNHLRKGTISVIHVPSSGVPKLTMPKCQMNVDAFLDACRKVGVDRVDLCSPADVLEEKSPGRLCKTVHCLLLAMGAAPPQIVMAKPPV